MITWKRIGWNGIVCDGIEKDRIGLIGQGWEWGWGWGWDGMGWDGMRCIHSD
jgi:hypothetical protein